MKKLITLLLTLLTMRSVAQEISGTVRDDKRQEVINVVIQALQDGQLKGGTVTDMDGHYALKLADGHYDIVAISMGFDSVITKGVIVTSKKRTTLNINMTSRSSTLREVAVIYERPVVDHDKTGTTVLDRKQIAMLPTQQITDAVSTAKGTCQRKQGSNVSMSGARTSETLYIIDGVRVQGTQGVDMAQGAVNAAPPPPLVFLDPSEESYKKNTENDFMNVKASPLSTMSVDVDRASYSNVRRFINSGQNPPADAVRVEEMINYFDYGYAQPNGKDPIAIETELTECPWQKDHKILHISMQARKIDVSDLPPSNLVFLIDVSGSMESPERLPLLVAGMKLLVQNLRENDKVTIVTYAGNAGMALPPTSGSNKQLILDALNRLEAGGSTAGGAGIQLAYKVAKENFIKGGNNRVLLATDGDFNVGVSSDNELEDLIVKERATGIYLTCLGFGTGNYKESKMEMLADKGNGNYDYIDNLEEAQKTLVHEFGGTLFTVAKDVKAQIEFNPGKVQGYRLIGYENRLLNTEDFKDDKKDAGDMGSGHTVTILYEIIPVGIKSRYLRTTNDLKYQKSDATGEAYTDELATIKFRYKAPDGEKSKEMTHTIADETRKWAEATENTRFSEAVAMFGMVLTDSKYKGTSNFEDVASMAKGSMQYDKEGYRAEFVKLVALARSNGTRTTAK